MVERPLAVLGGQRDLDQPRREPTLDRHRPPGDHRLEVLDQVERHLVGDAERLETGLQGGADARQVAGEAIFYAA